MTPTLTAPITPTVAITDSAAAAPAIVESPMITGTLQVSPTVTGVNPLAAASVAATHTYRDEIGGFELDYPASWSVVDVTPEMKEQALAYSITFMSWLPSEPGTDALPEGGSKIDVSVTKAAAASLDAAIEGRRQELATGESAAQILSEEPWELSGGLSGVRWTAQTSQGDTFHELVTAINGNRVMVSGLGDPALFERIAATLRPLPVLDPSAPVTMSGGEQAAAAPATELEQQVVVPMVASGGETALAQPQAATVYTVRQGDTLRKIAARFGVTIAAILRANPQITNPDRIYIGQRITIPSGGGTQPPPAATMPVNIYMIAIGGGSMGCGDQAVAVRRDIPKTDAPLTAALNLLLAQKSQYYGESGLYNALYQSNLRIGNITRSGTDWTISLVGTMQLGGVCDTPRVKAQLEQTALQFPTVKTVRYLINGTPLDTVLSGK
jgi:LysM repeat protein